MNTSWHNYPKIFALGHKAISDLFLNEVLIEEKIDGSQFSFGRFDGELKCRSKGAILNIGAPEKMFEKAVESIAGLDLKDGWTYRAEYLQKPKHNSLAYDRIPEKHVILFDINTGEEEYIAYADKNAEAKRIGLECVPIIDQRTISESKEILDYLGKLSILGGQKIEGVVIKNYHRFGMDKKVLMGKYVSEEFKEVHQKEWRKSNPSNKDVIQNLILEYKTPARWGKAIQHLKEKGILEQSPRDIGNLIKEVHTDIANECEDEIKEKLFNYAKPQILRGCTAGLAEWYKKELLEKQF